MAQQAPQPPRRTEQLHCFFGNLHPFDFTYCGSDACRTVALKRAASEKQFSDDGEAEQDTAVAAPAQSSQDT